ncbi:MAG: BMP family protein [Aestuariibacter sp.]
MKFTAGLHRMHLRHALLCLALVWMPSANSVNEFAPAVLWPEGEFSERNPFPLKVYEGVTLFERFHNIRVTKYRGPNAQRSAKSILLQAIAQNANPIFAFGVAYQEPIKELSGFYPQVTFVLIDGLSVAADNVLSVTFANEEGGFLMGVLAARITESRTVGFIGGMNNPSIRNFACGYKQGVSYISKDIQVLYSMIGDTAQAFNNPKQAKSLAIQQYEQGADIIFHASGGSGIGVFNAAQEKQKYAIGVDANQNALQPGRIVTSLLKRIDVVAYSMLRNALQRQLIPGKLRVGILDGALDWSLDEYNAAFFEAHVKAEMDITMAKLASGEIEVVAIPHEQCGFVSAKLPS